MKIKYILISMFFLVSCGSDAQFAGELVTQPFVSKLYGKTTKTIAIESEPGSHIAWMGLDQSGDYKYFKIEKISVNGRETIPTTVSPITILENISVGSVAATTPSQILITLTYSPSKGIESLDKPHAATLLITYDQPDMGVLRVELSGMTSGVIPGKCVRNAETAMEKLDYTIDNIKLYICDKNADFPPEQITPGAPGEKTNITDIPPIKDDKGAKENFVFYQPDPQTACILGRRDDVSDPSIPDFKLPIPKGIPKLPASLTELTAKLSEGFFAECSVNDGNIFCPANVDIEILNGIVPLGPLLTITNEKASPFSDDCKLFGDIEGKGKLGEETLELIAWGQIGSSSQIDQYKINGALVVAEIKLTIKK